MELETWGWNDAWRKAWRASAFAGTAQPGRIVSQREDVYSVVTEQGLRPAHPAGSLFHRGSQEERPAVGDWVAWQAGQEEGLVTGVLPRRSRFLREAPGGRGVAQVIASNVDWVWVVCPVPELNLNRLERFLVAICGGGAEPGVILSKADLVSSEALHSALAQVRGLMPDLVVRESSSPRERWPQLREELLALLEVGRTYALVGASGAGKSTLLNALVGEERQATGSVREGDGKGRHVTTFRELFALPNGALMMDTPGMREFALWADEGGLERVFSDLHGWARRCRFSNCAHLAEPGCAVQGALSEGHLSARRLHNWRGLRGEMEENRSRQQAMESRRQRTDLRRKKVRDSRFSRP